MSPTIQTGKVTDRRVVNYATVAEVRADVERLTAAAQRGEMRTTGNWTPGQVFQHLAKFIECSLDGFPFTAPWAVRVIGRAIKPWALRKPTAPSGMKLSGEAAKMLPEAGVSAEDASARLLAAIGRIERGEKMTHPSPLFGPLTHEQWVALHISHARLHLSFLHFK